MNKKGLIKLSIITGIILTLLLIAIFAPLISSIISKDSYELGENVKIDLQGIIDYKLKIITPSTSYVMQGSDDVFSFKPEEVGSYQIEVESSSGKEVYEFEVVGVEEPVVQEEIIKEEIIKEDNEEIFVEETNQETTEATNSYDYKFQSIEEVQGEEFLLGEKIRISLVGLGNYELKVVTPTRSYSRVGSHDYITIDLNEEGEYVLELIRGNAKTTYRFNAFFREEGILQKNPEVGSPVKWKGIINQNFTEIPNTNNLINLSVKNALTEEPVIYTIIEFGGRKYLRVTDTSVAIIIEFETPAPVKEEKTITNRKKEVKVSAPDEYGYKDVLASTSINEITSNKEVIKVYWKEADYYLPFDAYDTDGNGLLDRVEWYVPHLSNQTFEIIVITKADHLDSSRTFIEDVYEFVKKRDNNFTQAISSGEFIRVGFEENLTREKDITIYAKSNDSARVEVYVPQRDDSGEPKDSYEKIADFGIISDDKKYRILLNNLVGEQDTFDLKIVGGSVEFDYIVDPTETLYVNSFDSTYTAWDTEFGSSPYLDDSNDYIDEGGTNNALEGYFGFENSAISAGNINNVTIYFETYADDGPANDAFDVFVDDGNSGFSEEGTIAPGSSYAWHTLDVSTKITTWDEINNARIYVRYNRDSPGDNVRIRRAYLYVDHDDPGDIYNPDVYLKTPLDDAGTGVALNYFTANFSDNIDVDNATLYIWNSSGIVGTNFTTLSGTDDTANLSFTLPREDNYTWNYLAFDNNSNSDFQSTNFSLSYSATDTTGPVVTIIFPQNTTYHVEDIPLNFNVSLDENGSSVYYTLDNGLNNYSMSTTDNRYYNSTNSSIADGTYTIIIYANDTLGNRRDKINVTFTVDAVKEPWGFPVGPVELRAQTCQEQNTELTQNNFPDNCTGTYPASCDTDRMSCNEGTTEAATTDRSGGSDYYGGVRIQAYNDSISDCQNIDTVAICYEFYGASTQHTCTVGANANGSWVDNEVTCSETAIGTTCIDVTSNFTWGCGDFFGASDGSRAMAKSQAVKTEASGSQDWNFDVLFFNVTYTRINATVPYVTLKEPEDNSVLGYNDIFFTANFTEDSNLVNATLYVWYANSTLYGTNFTTITGTYNETNLSLSVSENGNYTWNYLAYDDSGNPSWSSSNYSFEIDTAPPTVYSVSPENYVNLTNSFDLNFVYNASDLGIVESCVMYVDGAITQTDNSITKNTNQTFYQYMSNGLHNWSVACNDSSGAFGYTQNRTVNVSITQGEFSGRFWESGPQSYTDETAYINLNNTRDTTTSNSVSYSIPSGELVTLVDAGSWFMGHNGAVIPSGTTVDFSTAFSSTNNQVALTWKLLVSNESGDTILCQNGDDSSGGELANSVLETATNSTCLSSGYRLSASDRIKLIINAYNTHGSSQSITHAWEGAFSSFVDVNVTTEGFLETNLTYPLTDPVPGVGETFNATCEVYCTIGTCRNTNVYIEYQTGGGAWNSISSSGNLILETGETNPHNLGDIGTTTVETNFSIEGNIESLNNIRCRAASTYDEENSTRTQQVSVGQAGAEAPVINKTSPGNLTWFNESTVVLYYNITDINDNIANSTLILNGLRNISNESEILPGEINNFTITLQDGTYNWTVNSTDLTNLEGTANNVTIFYVDTAFPTVDLIYPGDDDVFDSSDVEFNFTTTDLMDNILTCDLIIDGSVEPGHDNFNAISGANTNRTVTGLSIGDHYWNVTCTDEAGNTNTSETRNFTVNDLPPTVALVTGNNSFSNDGDIVLQYNATDNNGLINATLIINGVENMSNTTEILNGDISEFTLTSWPEGIYLWDVNVTDTYGFTAINGTPRTFTIDWTAPNITLNLPNNGTYLNGDMSFNWTVTDNIDTSMYCNFTVGSYSDNDIVSQNGSLTNTNVVNLPDGLQYWNVTCWDDAGNSNISELRFVNITEYPLVQLNTDNDSYFNVSTFNLTYTPSDNVDLANCSLYIDGVFNQSNQSQIQNSQPNNFTVTDISSGLHNWSVVCEDTYGLVNSSETRWFTVDLNGLNVTLLYPDDGEQYFTDTIEFSYNATDDIDNSLDCNITVNGEEADFFTATSGEITNRTVVFTEGGLKWWNVTCNDDSLNYFTSETRNFTLAFAPDVQLDDPFSGFSWNESEIALEYYVADDNNNIANATLILNGEANITNQSEIINEAVNNFTITLDDGFYEWSVNVTDLTNLMGNASTWNFTIDTGFPWIELNGQVHWANLTWNNITFNFTAYDLIDDELECDLTILNGGTEVVQINATNGTATVDYVVKSDGNYSWNVECTDNAGNKNITIFRNFSMLAPPNVTLVDPSPNEYINETDIDFTYYPEDPIGLYNCSLFIDGVFNDTTDTMNNKENNIFSVTDIPEGHHNWTVECADVAPDLNVYSPPARNFTVDLTPPQITLLAPENNSNVLPSVEFNFSALDLLYGENLTCELFIDGSLNVSNINLPNGTINSTTVTDLSLGEHFWNVSCIDNATNRNWSEMWSFNVTYSDLMVNSSSLVLSEYNPTENQTVEINATVYNLANVTITDIIVQFYDGDPEGSGVQIGSNQTISSILGLSETVVSINWSSDLGTSTIFVVVDPPAGENGAIEEWDETNNIANNSATVEGWHYFYGEIEGDSQFALLDSDSHGVVKWNATNFDAGNIYVTNSESSVTWSTLQAIGKDTSDVDTANDFTDIDTLLSMTTFIDSVNKTYLNSTGDIMNKTTYTIFNSIIDEVPVANSTNNTNFLTGMLWDYSDDVGDGEFSQDDTEDLIFISEINKGVQGTYGVYDYEIRIPARLREYIDSGDRETIFYAELR